MSTQPLENSRGGGDGKPPDPEPWGWTRRQRVGLGILLGLLVVFLGVQYVRRPARLEAVVTRGEAALPQRVDPNVASVAELARVPHVGDALAGKIVAYREARKGNTVDGVVFRQAGDLDAVPGIGGKLVEQLGPFMRFPEGP